MQYDLDTIIERLSEPEKLKDPMEVNTLTLYLNGYITDLEEEAWDAQLVASNRLSELAKTMSATKAKDIEWKLTSEWKVWQNLERTVSKIKRYRADLRDRLNLLTNQPRRY